MRTLLLAMIASCSPPPRPAAPPPAPAAITGGRVTFTTWKAVPIDSLFFSDDGHRLIAATLGRIVEIDPVARAEIASASLSSGTAPNPKGRPGVGETLSWTVGASVWAWDPAARSVVGVVDLDASGDALSGLAIWRPAIGQPGALPPFEGGSACAPLAISPDRTLFAARVAPGARDRCEVDGSAIRVFSLATGAPVTAPIEVGFAQDAAFSADGRYVAAGSTSVHVFDLRTQQLAQVTPTRPLLSLAVHPTQPIVAWSNDAGELESWRIGEPAPARRGIGSRIAFGPDGRTAATFDGMAILLDGTTLARREVLAGLTGTSADAIAFSADSRRLAVAVRGDVAVWSIPAAEPSPQGVPPPWSDAQRGWLARLQALPIPPPRASPRIERDGTADGRVLVADQPAANAEVTLQPHAQEYDDARALAPITVRTAADGRYRFDRVPAIVWQQVVTAPGATIGGAILDMREKRAQHADIILDEAATIVGSVLGPDNRPARDVRVFHAKEHAYAEVDIAAGPDGRFVIDHLRPGTPYAVTARRRDGAVRTQRVNISKAGQVRATFRLAAPRDPSVLHVVVVDAGGGPVANAVVSVETQYAKTDAAGRTSLDVDTSVTGSKSLRVRAVDALGHATSDIPTVDLPRPTPLTLRIDR